MQTRSSDENSVRRLSALPVCLSVWQTRELWQNRRKISPDFLIPYARSFSLVFWENKKLITRWDSERELFYDHIVHALQNNNIYGSIAEVCYHAKIHC